MVGGGAVGLEFGQMFSRFGSRVTMVDSMEEVGAHADREAAAELRAALEDEGIEFFTNAYVTEVKQEGDQVVAMLSPRDGRMLGMVRASKVLLASGRAPNVEELGLETVGVEVTKAGITVDDHMRTNVEGIWAAGDVTAVDPAHARGPVPGATRGRQHVRRGRRQPTTRSCRWRSSPTPSSRRSA